MHLEQLLSCLMKLFDKDAAVGASSRLNRRLLTFLAFFLSVIRCCLGDIVDGHRAFKLLQILRLDAFTVNQNIVPLLHWSGTFFLYLFDSSRATKMEFFIVSIDYTSKYVVTLLLLCSGL